MVKPSVWNLIERRITPLWVPDEQEDAILLKIQREEAEERERVKATRKFVRKWRVARALVDKGERCTCDSR